MPALCHRNRPRNLSLGQRAGPVGLNLAGGRMTPASDRSHS